MKTVTIELRDDYADVITVTFIGHEDSVTNIAVHAVKVRDGMVLRQECDDSGRIYFKEK